MAELRMNEVQKIIDDYKEIHTYIDIFMKNFIEYGKFSSKDFDKEFSDIKSFRDFLDNVRLRFNKIKKYLIKFNGIDLYLHNEISNFILNNPPEDSSDIVLDDSLDYYEKIIMRLNSVGERLRQINKLKEKYPDADIDNELIRSYIKFGVKDKDIELYFL